MKIRIRNNSVRFRLTKSEVSKLSSTGSIQSVTDLSNKSFIYAVNSKNDIEEMSVALEANGIILNIPDKFLADWAINDKMGFYGEQLNKSGSTTKLVLEKDFVCLDATAEDQSDNYENPKSIN